MIDNTSNRVSQPSQALPFDWHKLPTIYETCLLRGPMQAERVPYRIGMYDAFGNRPLPLHWHDAFEIGYIAQGSGMTVIEGVEFPFEPGQVRVISNLYRHMDYAYDYAQIFNVHFHPDLLHDLAFFELEITARQPFVVNMQRFIPSLPANDPHTQEIVALLDKIAHEHQDNQAGWSLAVKGLLLQTISLLVRYFLIPQDERSRADSGYQQELIRRLAPALQLLEERLVDPPTLAELASEVGMSPSHFGVLFHQVLGSSPINYRNTKRVSLALQLLAKEQMSIMEIADTCGFKTIQQFNRIFRRVLGCTPSDYRNQMRHYDSKGQASVRQVQLASSF